MDRPTDRHKPRTGDRHKPRTGNRHKEGYIRPDRKPENKAKTEKLWLGEFVSFDGEGWDGKYTLLACSAIPWDLYDPKGLSTLKCLNYLTDWRIKGNNACVGFGLSYDFENILKDVPDEDYISLIEGNTIDYKGFELKYIPRKILEIKREIQTKSRSFTKTVCLQDVLGFFQSSFEGALKKWEIPIPEIITQGKALRGDFAQQPLKFIKAYNRTELDLMIKLMEALRAADLEAFKTIGLKVNHSPRCWYGPGARASNFLKQTNWEEEHPAFTGPVFEELQNDVIKYYPKPIKPNRQTIKEIDKEINAAQGYIKSLVLEEIDYLNKQKQFSIYARIRTRGGISPSWSGAWAGEYLELPQGLKNRNGLPLDLMAAEFNLTVRELLDEIGRINYLSDKGIKTAAEARAKQTDDYKETVKLIEDLKAARTKAEQDPDIDLLQKITNLKENPFASAYFGGRIEAAGIGTFKEPLYDYDINSAYPFAISNLPKWEAEDLIKVKGFDSKNRIGMYFIEWTCPQGINFYPFPYRSAGGNVFFPSTGKGWYMSPEVNASLSVYGPKQIKVIKGYVLKDTEGAGDGLTKLPPEKLCTTAIKMDEIAILRLAAKAQGLTMEKTLKLIMNSCYGKLIQQIGSHKFMTLLAAAWITSTCRAIISRNIGQDTDNNIISIMTDGILTRKQLDVKLGKALGEFDRTDFDFAIQFMPGVYYLNNSKKPNSEVYRYRGMDKDFKPMEAVKILYKEVRTMKDGSKTGTMPINMRVFVTRTLALHQPNKFDKLRYTFHPVVKQEEFSLRSKREPGKKGFRLLSKEKNKFFAAKQANPIELIGQGSRPYVLDLPAELSYDTAKTEIELLANNRINSLMESDYYI